MNPTDILKHGTTTQDLQEAIAETTNERRYPELNIKPDDPRVIEHAERVPEF